MANDQNTIGFASNCPQHLEVWRKNSAQQAADDRFTVLFNECVDAYLAIEVFAPDTGRGSYCDGLVRAYALLTGDTDPVVLQQVARAAEARVPS